MTMSDDAGLASPRAGTRGRRPDPLKEQAILEAAQALFLEKGYVASVDEIAERAGVVKQTVYSRFRSKEDLFAACVRAGAEEVVAPLFAAAPGRSARQTLTAFAEQYRGVVLEPKRIRLFRLLIAEADKFPDVARRFYEDGPLYVRGRLAAFLDTEARAGALDIADAGLAASQFLGLIKGVEHLGALLGVSAAENELLGRARIARSVEAFLRLYAAGRS